MSAPATRHSSACAADWRHRHRRPRTRAERGMLDIRTPDVTARLLAEGVPAEDIVVVATEVARCVRFIANAGDDVLTVHLHHTTIKLIERYGDKLATLLMTTRGPVTR